MPPFPYSTPFFIHIASSSLALSWPATCTPEPPTHNCSCFSSCVWVVREPRQRRWQAGTGQDARNPSLDPSPPTRGPARGPATPTRTLSLAIPSGTNASPSTSCRLNVPPRSLFGDGVRCVADVGRLLGADVSTSRSTSVSCGRCSPARVAAPGNASGSARSGIRVAHPGEASATPAAPPSYQGICVRRHHRMSSAKPSRQD